MFITRGFWLVFLFALVVRVVKLQNRARRRIEYDPSLAEGYRQFFRYLSLLSALPWIVMGIGIFIGNVPTIFHFIDPKDGNPFVLAFQFALIFPSILFGLWIYFWDGAEFFVEYVDPIIDGFLANRNSTLKVKIWAAIWFLSSIIIIFLIFSRLTQFL